MAGAGAAYGLLCGGAGDEDFEDLNFPKRRDRLASSPGSSGLFLEVNFFIAVGSAGWGAGDDCERWKGSEVEVQLRRPRRWRREGPLAAVRRCLLKFRSLLLTRRCVGTSLYPGVSNRRSMSEGRKTHVSLRYKGLGREEFRWHRHTYRRRRAWI